MAIGGSYNRLHEPFIQIDRRWSIRTALTSEGTTNPRPLRDGTDVPHTTSQVNLAEPKSVTTVRPHTRMLPPTKTRTTTTDVAYSEASTKFVSCLIIPSHSDLRPSHSDRRPWSPLLTSHFPGPSTADTSFGPTTSDVGASGYNCKTRCF